MSVMHCGFCGVEVRVYRLDPAWEVLCHDCTEDLANPFPTPPADAARTATTQGPA